MRSARLLFVLAATSAPSAFAGNVLVVGPLPTQIAEIQAAVDAAIDGDVILVKSGTYATFSVPNKSVTIVADTAQVVNVDGAIRVRNLTADRAVVVSGLRSLGHYGTANIVVGNGFFATNCAGSIRVQDCVLRGFEGGPSIPCPSEQRMGAELENCADVAFVRCTITGSSHLWLQAPFPGNWPASQEGHGLVANGSSIALYDSTIHGGAGGNLCNGYNDGTDGGHAVVLTQSFLFASHSTIHGGDGMSAFGTDVYAGYGGIGLFVPDAVTPSHLLQSSVTGGAAGQNWNCGFCGTCCNGSPGLDYFTNGTYDVMNGTARVLAGSGVARESTQHALTVTGPPGDECGVAIRRATDFVWTPARFGVQLLSPPPVRILILGTIPVNGVLTTSIELPSVPSTDPGQTYHLQLITSGSTPTPHLGSPLSIAVVDAAY